MLTKKSLESFRELHKQNCKQHVSMYSGGVRSELVVKTNELT